MAIDDGEPIFDPEYDSGPRWSLENLASAAVAWIFISGVTLVILSAITLVTVTVLGIGA
ncbi:MAG: hypothetical protein IH933_07770 [Euryarchaeota archaeon]|nr:hypothetical protein [Euryarchaeota archaeon]